MIKCVRHRKKTEFNCEFGKILKSLGYEVYYEGGIKGGRRRNPDLVAISDKDALIIETKSESECGNKCFADMWLNWYSERTPYYIEFRKLCREELSKKMGKEIAGWLFTLGGQLVYYINTIGNTTGRWRVEGIDLTDDRYKIIPALAFPKSCENYVTKALEQLGIKNPKLRELPTDIIMVELERNELLNGVQQIADTHKVQLPRV